MKSGLALGLLLAISILAASWEISQYLGPRMFNTHAPAATGSPGQNGQNGHKSSNTTVSNPSDTKVSLLIDFGNGTRLWFNETSVSIDDNFYKVTNQTTRGNLNATWNGAYHSHFVQKIMGYGCNQWDPTCSGYWSLWIWKSESKCWSYSAVGVDLLLVSDVHTVAWYFTTSSQGSFPGSCK